MILHVMQCTNSASVSFSVLMFRSLDMTKVVTAFG